jgi:hypothetical protein
LIDGENAADAPVAQLDERAGWERREQLEQSFDQEMVELFLARGQGLERVAWEHGRGPVIAARQGLVNVA